MLGFSVSGRPRARDTEVRELPECAPIEKPVRTCTPDPQQRGQQAPTFLTFGTRVVLVVGTMGGVQMGVRHAEREELRRLESKTLDARFRAGNYHDTTAAVHAIAWSGATQVGS
jgi:hypothetical protein